MANSSASCPSELVGTIRCGQWGRLLKHYLKKLDNNDKLKRRLGSLTDYESRAELLRTETDIVKGITKFLADHKNVGNCECNPHKSDRRARIYINGAEGYLRGGDHQTAADILVDAIRFASVDSGMLANAYAHRANAYYKMKLYGPAVEDVDSAMSVNYAQHYKSQAASLLHRKCESLIRSARLEEAKQCLLAIPRLDNEATWKWLAQFLVNTTRKMQHASLLDAATVANAIATTHKCPAPSLEDVIEEAVRVGAFLQSDTCKTLSDKLEFRYDPNVNGAYLVAKESICFGEILSVEKYYATVMEPRADIGWCHHCYVVINFHSPTPAHFKRSVPCSSCSYVLFCSEKCRTDAWATYHQYECRFMGFLMLLNQHQRLAFRVLLSAGSADAVLRTITQSEDPANWGDYGRVYHQVCEPENKFSSSSILEVTMTAILLAKIARECGFVPEGHQLSENALTNVLLRHIVQMELHTGDLSNNNQRFNTYHSKSTSPPSSPSSSSSSSDADNDLNIVATLRMNESLMSHSCDPNTITMSMLPDGQYENSITNWMNPICDRVHVARASKCIEPGERITFGYGRIHFTESNRDVRQRQLWSERRLRCACARCELEVANNPRGSGPYYPIGCAECEVGLVEKKGATGEFQCNKCHAKVPLGDMHAKYREIDKDLESANRLAKKIVEAPKGLGGRTTAPTGELITQLETLITKQLFEKPGLLHHGSSWHLAQKFDSLCGILLDYPPPGANPYELLHKSIEFSRHALLALDGCYGPESMESYVQLKKVLALYARAVAAQDVPPMFVLYKTGEAMVNMRYDQLVERAEEMDKLARTQIITIQLG